HFAKIIMIFYTYLWLREDGTPYYVGKGTRRRAFEKHTIIGTPPSNNRILLEPHTTEEEAFKAEIFLIAYYGRKDIGTGILRNLTDGGDGVVGCKNHLRGAAHPMFGKTHSLEVIKVLKEKYKKVVHTVDQLTMLAKRMRESGIQSKGGKAAGKLAKQKRTGIFAPGMPAKGGR